MLQRQVRARALTRLVHTCAVQHGVGARDVHEFEHAHARLLTRQRGDGGQAVLVGDHDLAGLHVAHQLRAQRGQRAAFGGEDQLPGALADTQRPEALRVAGGQQLFGAHHHDGVGAAQALHGVGQRLLGGGGLEALAGEDVGDDLAVVVGVEDGAAHLQLLAQLARVAQLAVEADGDVAAHVADDHGLGGGAVSVVAGAVAHMAHRDVAVAQRVQHLAREHLGHQAVVLVGFDDAVVAHRDAAAHLAAVLQRVERKVGAAGHVLVVRVGVNAEYAALVVQLHVVHHGFLSLSRFLITHSYTHALHTMPWTQQGGLALSLHAIEVFTGPAGGA